MNKQEKKYKAKETIIAEYDNWNDSHGVQPSVAAKAKAGHHFGKSSSSSTLPRVKVPKKLDITLAKQLLPAHCSLFESSTEKRVRGFYQRDALRESTSASLSIMGEHKAVLWCLQWCHKKAIEHRDQN
eukprot:11161167-Lingulodinium_polyedra.AAC.1